MASKKKKKGVVAEVVEAVKEAASTVAKAAETRVIQPVGKALGVTGKGKAPAKPKSAPSGGPSPLTPKKPKVKKPPRVRPVRERRPAPPPAAPKAEGGPKTVAALLMTKSVADAAKTNSTDLEGRGLRPSGSKKMK